MSILEMRGLARRLSTLLPARRPAAPEEPEPAPWVKPDAPVPAGEVDERPLYAAGTVDGVRVYATAYCPRCHHLPCPCCNGFCDVCVLDGACSEELRCVGLDGVAYFMRAGDGFVPWDEEPADGE